MTGLRLPDDRQRRLVYYLAMEEWAAEHLDELGCADTGAFFLWQVPPTVIFGRNQDMEAEVNVDYCREKGIAMWRRKSGGGCVYSDYGNLMLSFIMRGSDVQGVFRRCLDDFADCLRGLGIDAEVSGRNDILAGGGKISGNAFSFKPSHPATAQWPERRYDVCIVHGTLLYDLDFGELSKAITPSRSKLESKAVKSVEQRVRNLKPLLDERNMSLERLKSALISYFCKTHSVLSPRQMEEVSRIELSYLDPDFIKGRHLSAARISDAL